MSIWLKILVGFFEIGLCEVLVIAYVAQRLYGMWANRGRSIRASVAPPRPVPFDRTSVDLALQAELNDAKLKLPPELFSKVQSITDMIGGILPRYHDLASDDLSAVIKTATEYLPGVLQPYFKLPPTYVSRPLPEAQGKTAQQVLSSQLDLLNRKVRDVDDALHRKDIDALISHERVLEAQFGQSSLAISATPMDPDAVQSALSAQLSEVKDRLPQDLQEKVQAVASAIVDILPAYRESGLAPQDLFVVERTVDDYLPTAVQNYLKLPSAYTSIPLPEAEGKTARQLLSDQLDLLVNKMHEVADAAHRKDVEALLVHGRFLEDKFGPSSLAIRA